MYNSSSGTRIDIRDRTFRFGVRVIRLVRVLPKDASGFAIGGQVVRSGTSIGANIEEAQNSSSKKEFIHSLTISLKEARETDYWLRMIGESGLIDKNRFNDLLEELIEIVKILITIIKNTKSNTKLHIKN